MRSLPRPVEPHLADERARSPVAVDERAPLNGTRHDHSTPEGSGERIDLPITGMTCAACANRIERSLNKTPGVRKAGVNYATGRATVEYDPQATGLRQLMDRVKDVGYDTAATAHVEFVVDDSARPSGSAAPLERELARCLERIGGCRAVTAAAM